MRRRSFVTTTAQRIVRAKNKIRAAHIPYGVPDEAELPDRLRAVLAVVYLVFNEGYIATSGPAVGRPELANEAIRLGRLLVGLMPDEPEAVGLPALMLLTESRRPARTLPDGSLARLADAPTPVVRLNRAVAVAEVEGAAAAIDLVEPLALTDYYLWHAVLADLYERTGLVDDARAAYSAAIARTDNEAERALLRRRQAALPLP